MTGARPADILRQLEEPSATDRELLALFVRERDQTAFAELVRKHGSIVLGVCRRMTGHPQDAEDAFQAVFLILARKAAAIRNPDLLGNWLYGVAVRIAQTARRSSSRRRAREVAVSAMPDTPVPPAETVSELSPILDEELVALPPWYHDATQFPQLGLDLPFQIKKGLAAHVPAGEISDPLPQAKQCAFEHVVPCGIDR
jgi:hypothetical protein